MFWIGFIIGYIVGMITCFIVELLCISTNPNEINKWTYEEVESELNRSKEETTTPRD